MFPSLATPENMNRNNVSATMFPSLARALEARSAIVRARASESSTCFPCWKSNQVTSFWRELFRVRSRRKVSIITFPVSYNGSKAMLFLRSHGGENHANQAFFHVSPVPEFFPILFQYFPYNVVGLQPENAA